MKLRTLANQIQFIHPMLGASSDKCRLTLMPVLGKAGAPNSSGLKKLLYYPIFIKNKTIKMSKDKKNAQRK